MVTSEHSLTPRVMRLSMKIPIVRHPAERPGCTLSGSKKV